MFASTGASRKGDPPPRQWDAGSGQRPPGPHACSRLGFPLASCAESHPRMGKGRCSKRRIRAAVLRRLDTALLHAALSGSLLRVSASSSGPQAG